MHPSPYTLGRIHAPRYGVADRDRLFIGLTCSVETAYGVIAIQMPAEEATALLLQECKTVEQLNGQYCLLLRADADPQTVIAQNDLPTIHRLMTEGQAHVFRSAYGRAAA